MSIDSTTTLVPNHVLYHTAGSGHLHVVFLAGRGYQNQILPKFSEQFSVISGSYGLSEPWSIVHRARAESVGFPKPRLTSFFVLHNTVVQLWWVCGWHSLWLAQCHERTAPRPLALASVFKMNSGSNEGNFNTGALSIVFQGGKSLPTILVPASILAFLG